MVLDYVSFCTISDAKVLVLHAIRSVLYIVHLFLVKYLLSYHFVYIIRMSVFV